MGLPRAQIPTQEQTMKIHHNVKVITSEQKRSMVT